MRVDASRVRRPHRHQTGTILIMALLIVAVVAGLSIRFASEYQLSLSRAENRWHGQQARAYLHGVEALAITWMKEDDPTVDYIGEGWDTEIPYEIEGGWLAGSLSDASSRLNLNSLGRAFPPDVTATSPQRYSEEQKRFIRLLQSFPDLPVTLDEAIVLLEAIVDWMDADDTESGFGGAENFYYQSLETPYRAANGPFMSVDELRLVRYITPQLMTLLRNYVTVLPAEAGLNINTMPSLLWRTLNASNELAPLGAMDVEQLTGLAPADGYYKDLTELATNWGAVGNGVLDVSGLAVNTQYFWLRTQVSLVDQQRIMFSLVHRNGPELNIVRRADGY
jgi:general secretion pathway protein K